jgi:hypothetical protein
MALNEQTKQKHATDFPRGTIRQATHQVLLGRHGPHRRQRARVRDELPTQRTTFEAPSIKKYGSKEQKWSDCNQARNSDDPAPLSSTPVQRIKQRVGSAFGLWWRPPCLCFKSNQQQTPPLSTPSWSSNSQRPWPAHLTKSIASPEARLSFTPHSFHNNNNNSKIRRVLPNAHEKTFTAFIVHTVLDDS